MSRQSETPRRDNLSRGRHTRSTAAAAVLPEDQEEEEQQSELSNTVSNSYDDDDTHIANIGSSGSSSKEDAAAAESIAYGWTKQQLIHFFTMMVEFLIRNSSSKNFVNQALKSRRAEFIDQSKKLGPLLKAKQRQLTIDRGQGEQPSLADTVAFVLEENNAEHKKYEDVELLVLLLTALTKLVWDDARLNPCDGAKSEFSLFILKAIMFYSTGAVGYKSFLNHEAFLSLATEDLKGRATGLLEGERAGKKGQAFLFKLGAKKIILAALFGNDGMDDLVQALHDEDEHSKEVLQKINSKKVPLIYEAVKDRIALPLHPDATSEKFDFQYWIRGPGRAISVASPHTSSVDSAASPPRNNKNSSSSPSICSPTIRQLLDPNLTFQGKAQIAAQLDEQHPGHGYLEAFTKPALASLPSGAEITQSVASSAEKEQVAASVVSADETETGKTVPLPGSSRHAPCTLELLLYDDTVRACIKKQENQSEGLDKTFADLPTILEKYESDWRPELKTDLDRAAAGRVWTLDDFVVYKWLGEGSFATTFLAASVESPGSLVVVRLEEHYHQDILMYFIRPTVCNAMVDQENVANVLAWFAVPPKVGALSQNPPKTPMSGKKKKTKAPKVLTATIMPFYSGGELTARIDSISSEMDATKKVCMIVEIMQPLLAAMVGYERKGVIHRDIKPENLLFDGDGSLKVCDHGLSREVSEDGEMTVKAGSPKWMAPEVANGQMRMSNKMDMWSCGIIEYKLMTGEFPARNEDLTLGEDVFNHNAIGKLQAVTGGHKLVSLCKNLLRFDSDSRITATPAKAEIDEIANDLPKEANKSG